MSPSWHSATSNDSSGSGRASALASCHSMELPEGVAIEGATASIPGIGSTPATLPVPPSRSAARRVT